MASEPAGGGVPPAVMVEMGERLAALRRQHGVAIPLAIESGSRAWGFPSPDSDYDCRFVFVRRVDEYLSPWRRRDVIEEPIDGEVRLRLVEWCLVLSIDDETRHCRRWRSHGWFSHLPQRADQFDRGSPLSM